MKRYVGGALAGLGAYATAKVLGEPSSTLQKTDTTTPSISSNLGLTFVRGLETFPSDLSTLTSFVPTRGICLENVAAHAIHSKSSDAAHSSPSQIPLLQALSHQSVAIGSRSEISRRQSPHHPDFTDDQLIDFASRAHDLLQRVRVETGAPGLTAAIYTVSNSSYKYAQRSHYHHQHHHHHHQHRHHDQLVSEKDDSTVALPQFYHQGRVVWEGAAGYADLELGTPMQPNMKLRIASISKTLSSILCAWLVRQGIVDWDTPIGQIVPSSGQHTSPSSSLTSSPSTPTSSTSPPTSTSTPPILSDGGLVPNYWRSEWVKLMEDEAEAKKAEEKKKKEKSKGEKEKSKREETGKETALYVKAMSAYKGQGYKSSIPRPVTPVAETIHSQTKNDKFSPFTSQSSPFSTTTSTSSSTAPPPPPFPSHWLSVTLRQLLSHTAGVRGYLGDEFESCVSFPSTTAALLPFIFDKPIYKPTNSQAVSPSSSSSSSSSSPSSLTITTDDGQQKIINSNHLGSKYQYTTHGYTLASFVAEALLANQPLKKEGEESTFTAGVRRYILAPLGLYDTLPEGQGVIPLRAKQYVRKHTKLTPAPQVDLSAKYGGGGYLSTASDIAKLGGSLVCPHPFLPSSITDELWRSMYVPKKVNGDQDDVPPISPSTELTTAGVLENGLLSSSSLPSSPSSSSPSSPTPTSTPSSSPSTTSSSTSSAPRLSTPLWQSTPLIPSSNTTGSSPLLSVKAESPTDKTSSSIPSPNPTNTTSPTSNSNTSVTSSVYKPTNYGMGWEILKRDELLKGRLVGHSGGAVGGSSYMLLVPEEGLCVALIANQNDCTLRQPAIDLAKELVKLRQTNY